MRGFRLRRLFFLASVPLLTGVAHAATLSATLGPHGTYFDTNGDNVADLIQPHTGLFAGESVRVIAPTVTVRGIYEFEVPAITDSIVSATLILTETDSVFANGGNVEVYGYQGNGTLDASDWGDGSSLDTVLVDTSGGTYSWDVTALISSIAGPASTWAGFNLQMHPVAPDTTATVVFHGELPSPTDPEWARLEITVVPIPAAVWLFGSALAGLGWMRRKA